MFPIGNSKVSLLKTFANVRINNEKSEGNHGDFFAF